jgi:transposase-like protein
MLKTVVVPRTLHEAIRYFQDRDRAFAFVVQLRWPNGVTCPHCKAEKPSFLKTRYIWKCRKCRKQFSVKVGTIFEDSPLGLDKWLPALWMLANSKNGISSYELGRALGVTQKSAWFMLHRVRMAMETRSFKRFGGKVEVDETFIGGAAKFMHASRKKRVIRGTGGMDKTPVMGILKRGTGRQPSQVRAIVLANRWWSTIQGEITRGVRKGSKLFTDTAWSYGKKGELRGMFKHEMINHARAYVKGEVHTNGLENFWSLLKRAIKGTYVSVDPFHLMAYVGEQVRRFNNRKLNDGERFVDVLKDVSGRRLTYRDLIGADLSPATT